MVTLFGGGRRNSEYFLFLILYFIFYIFMGVSGVPVEFSVISGDSGGFTGGRGFGVPGEFLGIPVVFGEFRGISGGSGMVPGFTDTPRTITFPCCLNVFTALIILIRTFSKEREAEKCPSFKNMLRKYRRLMRKGGEL